MGHVDHGKTTMLDYLRKSSVAANEAGGITQHIGAFQVSLKSPNNAVNLITFLDTPGHAAFSAMRRRGAKVTDIIVLVVAVEDGVMPQTEEVVSLAKSYSIPMIVAMNKWDKIHSLGGSANSPYVRKLKDSLARLGVELEEFGGPVQCIPISAASGFNMDVLQEAIIAESELMELQADPSGALQATIIEAKVLPGRGVSTTVIVKEGTLSLGEFLVAENTYCKVRSMSDSARNSLKLVSPAQPCEITGWKDSTLPPVGSQIFQLANEAECKKYLADAARDIELQDQRFGEKNAIIREKLDRQLLQLRKDRSRDLSLKPIHLFSYDQLSSSQERTKKVLEVLIHADVTGSLEAICKALNELPQNRVAISVVGKEIGPPTANSADLLGTCTNPLLISFNVNASGLEKLLKPHKIPFMSQNIIYHMIDDVRERMTDLLPPLQTELELGRAKVLQTFSITGELVAGCRVEDGILTRHVPSSSTSAPNAGAVRAPEIKFVLERKGKTIWSGQIKTFKHQKKDITQAQKGMECGLIFSDLNDFVIQVDDFIKCVKISYRRDKL